MKAYSLAHIANVGVLNCNAILGRAHFPMAAGLCSIGNVRLPYHKENLNAHADGAKRYWNDLNKE